MAIILDGTTGITTPGLINTGSETVVNLTTSGNTTLGDAAGDTLTLNGTAVTTPNGLNFDSNTLVIDATNNRVGIGTASPNASLTVRGDVFLPASTTETVQLEIGVGRTGNGFSAIDLIGDATYSDYGLRVVRGNTGQNAPSTISHRGLGELQLASVDAGSITFTTNNTERMNITSSGNVGIGTSSPNYKMTVNGGASATAIQLVNTSSGTGAGDGLLIYQDGVDSRVQNTEVGNLTLWTGNNERMRILSNGAVIIGGTTQDSAEQFRVVSYASIGSAGVSYPGAASRWSRGKNLIAFTWSGPNLYGAVDGAVEMVVGTTSDYRLKTNNAPLTGSLDVILNLKPITYNSVSFNGAVNNDVTEVGLIAHEVQAVRPSLVTGTKDKIGENGKPTYQSLNYAGLVPDLIKAMQELKTIVDAQAERIAVLENK